MYETPPSEIVEKYAAFPDFQEIVEHIQSTDPTLLDLPNCYEDLRTEWEETQRAMRELSQQFSRKTQPSVWNTKEACHSKFGEIFEIVGLPNVAKTTSLLNIRSTNPRLFKYRAEPDKSGKAEVINTRRHYSIAGADYGSFDQRCERQTSSMLAATGYLIRLYLFNNPSLIHLMDRSIMDEFNVWSRTFFLDGQIILPRPNDSLQHYGKRYMWELTETSRYTIPTMLPTYPWNVIICLAPIKTVLSRKYGQDINGMKAKDFTDKIHNPLTLKILTAQYLRLFHLCLQKNNLLNVILLDLDGLTMEETETLIRDKILELHEKS